MADLLVDTDVLIDHLRGRHRLSADVGSVAISVLSHCELFAGHDEPERLRRFLLPMTELPIDPAIAELAGVTRLNTGIATPDALVAATALHHRLPLMTRNRRHYDRVPALRIIAPV